MGKNKGNMGKAQKAIMYRLKKLKDWFYQKKCGQFFLRLFGRIGKYQWCQYVVFRSNEIEGNIPQEIIGDWIREQKVRMLKDAQRFLPRNCWNSIKIIVRRPKSISEKLAEGVYDPYEHTTVAWKYTPPKGDLGKTQETLVGD